MADDRATVAAAVQRMRTGELSKGGLGAFLTGSASASSRFMPASVEAVDSSRRQRAGEMDQGIGGHMTTLGPHPDNYLAQLPGDAFPKRVVRTHLLHGGELTSAGSLARFYEVNDFMGPEPAPKARGWTALKRFEESNTGDVAGCVHGCGAGWRARSHCGARPSGGITNCVLTYYIPTRPAASRAMRARTQSGRRTARAPMRRRRYPD
jgi:hypothetical protein